MCIDYEKALDSARRAANKAQDGQLTHNGEVYNLTFDHRHWHYVVTDSAGNLVGNFNMKSLSKAKAYLKQWLNS